jgi:hypothetical protein
MGRRPRRRRFLRRRRRQQVGCFFLPVDEGGRVYGLLLRDMKALAAKRPMLRNNCQEALG